MAEFVITSPDGKTYKITAPDNATDDQVRQYAQQAAANESSEASQGYQTGRKGNSSIRGAMAALQGPTFGFADEISGAVNAPLQTLMNDKSLGENYRNIRDRYRGAVDQSKADAPWTTGITQAITSAPLIAVRGPAILQAKSAEVSGWLANALRAAGAGTIYGGTQGAGDSTADTVGGVLSDAGNSAMTSAILSGTASPVFRIGGAAAKNVAQRVSDKWAGSYAQQKVAEAFARDARGTLFTSGQADPATQAVVRFNRLGPEAAVADAGGRNTNQLLDTLATLPGRTKEAAANFLGRRKTTVGNRLRDSAEEALGATGERLAGTVDDLIAQRTKDSKPLYALVRETKIWPTQTLRDIVNVADELGAMGDAKLMAKARQRPFTLDPKNPGVWNMGDLDLVKRGLDQKIAAETNALGKVSPLGADFQSLKTKLISELDDATLDSKTGQSLYKNARAAFSGPSALIDAADAGKRAITQDEAGITKAMKGMDAGELQAFRIGAYEGLRSKLGTRSGQTSIMNMNSELTQQEKLKVIFGDMKSYRKFAVDVAKEARLKRLQATDTGSRTMTRQAGMGDLDVAADVGQAVTAAQTGNFAGAILGAKTAWNRVATPQTVRDQMGSILLSQGRAGGGQLSAMQDLIRRINRNSATASRGTGMLSSGVAANFDEADLIRRMQEEQQ